MSRLKNPFVAFNQLSNKCLLPKLSLAINEKPHYLHYFKMRSYNLIIYSLVTNVNLKSLVVAIFFIFLGNFIFLLFQLH